MKLQAEAPVRLLPENKLIQITIANTFSVNFGSAGTFNASYSKEKFLVQNTLHSVLMNR